MGLVILSAVIILSFPIAYYLHYTIVYRVFHIKLEKKYYLIGPITGGLVLLFRYTIFLSASVPTTNTLLAIVVGTYLFSLGVLISKTGIVASDAAPPPFHISSNKEIYAIICLVLAIIAFIGSFFQIIV